nr:hypothetical protein [Tanacetum cinerariifolium]
MILLAYAITQHFSNLTDNRLHSSSNSRNQAIVQDDRNDVGNIKGTLRTTSSGTAANVQCYNCSEKGPYARNFPKPRVRDSVYFMKQMFLAKQDEAGVILTDIHNDFLFAVASRMEEIEELSANICLMTRIRPSNFDFDEGPSYDFAFLSENQDLLITISKLKAKLKNAEEGLRSISMVGRPSHRGSSFKKSVLSNNKNSSEKVEVFDRTYKKSDVASKNVDSNKKNHNCLEKYKLDVHSKFSVTPLKSDSGDKVTGVATMAENVIAAASETRPLMLEKVMYGSWKTQIMLYIRGKDGVTDIRHEQRLEDLKGDDKLCYDSYIKAVNILLLGLPVDIYTLINHYQTAKEI